MHAAASPFTDHLLLTCAQMAQADAHAAHQGVPGMVLMARAGQAVADAIRARWSPRPVLVACGPGNNGGDGHVVARLLHEAGWPVTLASLVPTAALKGDALHHARRAEAVLPVQALHAGLLAGQAMVVDALFGAGLNAPLEGEAAALLKAAAHAGVVRVSIDVPSGLRGDSGEDWGAVPADLTVTFHRKKPAHVLWPGRGLCGELLVRDIGIPPGFEAGLALQAWENGPALWQHAWPYPGSLLAERVLHKYTRGHVAVLGGAVMTGAARLAARAAVRVGAGLSTLLVPRGVWPVYATAQLSGMVQALDDVDATTLRASWRAQLGSLKWRSLVLGPGAALGLPEPSGETLSELVLLALSLAQGRGVVLDADALTAFEGHGEALFDAILGPVVLTPHEGEFLRLFGRSAHDKLQATREAARRSGAVVLLKGADTVIASPDGRAVVNTNGPATLATAGSGDVLSGLIGGLLAQGLPAFEAACAGAWLHGACAQAFGPGLIADDLPEQLPGVLRSLWA
ncbi:NAD(P)H-hydrate dehydratase [Aquabacterium sp.]|uniref:NAD(P)H-hydrate dehydratase n=1 Tax=Aquabacterium sp. TaxID=1872578 RepID=UPI0025C303A2|nr:NAD(P)H-hydrate dehydratase [Aquabacterium sp.]